MSNKIATELIKKCEQDILDKAAELQKDKEFLDKSYEERIRKALDLFMVYAEGYYTDYAKAIEEDSFFSTEDKEYYDAIPTAVYNMRVNQTIQKNSIHELEAEQNRFYKEYFETQEHLESALSCAKESDVFVSFLENRKNLIRENIYKLASHFIYVD
jgi:hypothetical protein